MPAAPFAAALRAFASTVGPAGRLRYAPTPSGFLHRGNAFNFILNFLVARAHPGARLLLRIDDLDAERIRPEFVADVFESLAWLGLDWDEGPRSPSEFEATWSQRHRLPLYLDALEGLRATGRLFACAKSRSDLAPFGGAYPEAFRRQGLDLDQPGVSWRLRTPPGFVLPDFVVRRRDGRPAYQLASVVDDLHFGVTHLIRGADLEASTAAQRYLAECLGWTDFFAVRVLHHPLVFDERGEKLSKSAGSAALRSRYGAGQPPGVLYRDLARWLGVPDEGVQSAADLSKTIF